MMPLSGWAQTAVDWSLAAPAISGNGTYTGEVDGIDWELTAEDAASVTAMASDPTLLGGLIDASANAETATYTLDFGQPVYIDWENDFVSGAGGVGGPAGFESSSDEFVTIPNGGNRYTLEDDSANIVPAPPGAPGPGAYSPVFPLVFFPRLQANSQPGRDHAYYIAHSIGGQTRLAWTHDDEIAKAEAWRVTVSPCGIDADSERGRRHQFTDHAARRHS